METNVCSDLIKDNECTNSETSNSNNDTNNGNNQNIKEINKDENNLIEKNDGINNNKIDKIHISETQIRSIFTNFIKSAKQIPRSSKHMSKNYFQDELNDPETKEILNLCTHPLIKAAMVANIKKRNLLKQISMNLDASLLRIKSLQNDLRRKSHYAQKNSMVISRKRLGFPYFKTKEFFPCPSNTDVQKCNEIEIFNLFHNLGQIRVWTFSDKSELVKEIYEEIRVQCLQQVQTQMLHESSAKLEKIQSAMRNADLIRSLAKKWQNILLTIQPNGKIIVTVDKKVIAETHDTYCILTQIKDYELNETSWNSISSNLESKFTSNECANMWKCYLHPTFSKKPWTTAENEQLANIAEKHKFEDWPQIAQELNINKSPYQCCIHYWSKLNIKINRKQWSVEEEEYLDRLINIYDINSQISWQTIRSYITDRDKTQIYAHYLAMQIDDLVRGSFRIEEDILLLAMLKYYENDLRKVRAHLPHRMLSQLKDRQETISKDDGKAWTVEEDCQLIDHVKNMGYQNWHLLKNLNRSTACIRHRVNTIKRWFEQNPGDSLKDVPRRGKDGYNRHMRLRYTLLTSGVLHIIELLNKGIIWIQHLNINMVHVLLRQMDEFEEFMEYQRKLDESEMLNSKKILVKKLNSHKTKSIDTQIAVETPPNNNNNNNKTNPGSNTLHKHFVEFFKPTYKSITRGRRARLTDEDVTSTAKRIMKILVLFNANLNLPDEKGIDNNIYLTSVDKIILKKILQLKCESENSNTIVKSVTIHHCDRLLPPTAETIMGIRGLLLHNPTLRSHCHGEYAGYEDYVYVSEQYDTQKRAQYAQKRSDMLLQKLEPAVREKIIKDRLRFWLRFEKIFSWPCILQETKIEPKEMKPSSKIVELEDDTDIEAEIVQSSKQSLKKGRPSKTRKNWKINLMNKVKQEKLQTDEPNTSNDNRFIISQDSAHSIKVILAETENSQFTENRSDSENDSDDDAYESIQRQFYKTICTTDNSETIKQMSNALVHAFTTKNVAAACDYNELEQNFYNIDTPKKIKQENFDLISLPSTSKNSNILIRKHYLKPSSELSLNTPSTSKTYVNEKDSTIKIRKHYLKRNSETNLNLPSTSKAYENESFKVRKKPLKTIKQKKQDTNDECDHSSKVNNKRKTDEQALNTVTKRLKKY